ncbi:MAG: serine/threonine-protein kinase [Planctomycetota bacterium]
MSRRVEELFHEAVQRDPAEQEAWLAEACSDDAALLAEVLPLVRAHGSTDDFLEKPLQGREDLPVAKGWDSGLIRHEEEALISQRVGAWKLVRRIAAGGMGTVYEAIRDDGQYEHRAAIKLIRPGIRFDEPRHRLKVIRQFRDEQQHLANLDHPNIAKLLDGGTTEDGLPYIVIEYVQGVPITKYCEEHGLTPADRLRLLLPICRALQHAHGKLIAHRDLKPSNILVSTGDGQPTPRLLDFGIAQVLKDKTREDGDKITSMGLLPMTPDYASPEQIRGEPISIVSDVYSLGVVLYEVLTGHLPHEDARFTAEWILSDQVAKPPSRVRRSISRDIDTIVLKAMDKSPARRYQSVGSLVDDIERFLAGLPVLAHPPSASYQLSKFVSRNKWGIASTLFLLALGISGGLWIGLSRVAAQEKLNQEELRNLASSFFYVARSSYNDGHFQSAEAIMRKVMAIEAELPSERDTRGPWMIAQERELLGAALLRLGQLDEETERHLVESYRDIKGCFGPDRTMRAHVRITLFFAKSGQAEKAGIWRELGVETWGDQFVVALEAATTFNLMETAWKVIARWIKKR